MISFLLIALLCLIWGSTWLGIKIGLEGSPPMLSAGFRFLLAIIILYFWGKAKKIKFQENKRELPKILIPGLFLYFASYTLVYWSEQYINSGLAAVLFATFPFFVAIFAFFLLPDEKVNLFRLAGLTIGFSGIVVVFWDSLSFSGENALAGMMAMIGSGFCSAYATVRIKRDLSGVHPVVATSYQMSLGAFLLISFGLVFEKLNSFKITYQSMGALLYLALFGSALAFGVYYWLLKKMEATKLSLIAFITPVVALFLGWLVLDERITWRLTLGALGVIIGVWLVNRKPPLGNKATV